MAKSQTSADFMSQLGKLEDTLETYLVDKAPFQLPKGAKEFIVKYGPWLILVSLPFMFLGLGFGALIAPFTLIGGVGLAAGFGLGMVLALVAIIMEAIALPGLFKNKINGWRLMYYATLIWGIKSLFPLDLGGLVFTIIPLYFAFQIKSYYK